MGLPAYPAVPKMDFRPPLKEANGGGRQAIRRRQSTHSVFTKESFNKSYLYTYNHYCMFHCYGNLFFSLTGSLWHDAVLESRGLLEDWSAGFSHMLRLGSPCSATRLPGSATCCGSGPAQILESTSAGTGRQPLVREQHSFVNIRVKFGRTHVDSNKTCNKKLF